MILGIVSETYVSRSFVLIGCAFLLVPNNIDFHVIDGLRENYIIPHQTSSYHQGIKILEAVVPRCSVKKVFLEISQN